MSGVQLDPFMRAGTVPADHLFGRDDVLRVALSNLLNPGGSIAIDGEWLSGKSSVLQFLADPVPHLATDGQAQFSQHVFVFINCQDVGAPFSPALFWRRVLERLRRKIERPDVVQEIDERLASDELDHNAIHSIVERIGQDDMRLVLILDDFHAVQDVKDIVAIANFADGLRSLITRQEHKAHIVVGTYRPLPVVAASFYVGFSRSPFENYFVMLGLRTLRHDDVQKLVNLALLSAPVTFTDADTQFITQLSGGHPYLVQLAGSVLYNARLTTSTSSDDLDTQAQGFMEEAATLFQRMWASTSSEEQMLLTLLALDRLQGKLNKKSYDLGDLDSILKRYGREVSELARRGQISRTGTSAESIQIFSPAYEWWIQREIESGSRQDLRAREHLVHDLIPRGQVTSIVQALRVVYERKDAIANMAEWTVKVARRLALAAVGGG